MELPSLPVMPLTIEQKLLAPGGITPTAFERKNDVLTDPSLQTEVGYTRLPNGDWLVAMTCPMPNVTPEMLDWWFWWHAQKSERYRLWFPGEHYAVSYAKKDRPYFTAPAQPPFRANTHFPVEKIGALVLPLRIDFVSPEDFGFSRQAMDENGVARIVCGHVGAMYGLVRHTEMAHRRLCADQPLLARQNAQKSRDPQSDAHGKDRQRDGGALLSRIPASGADSAGAV